MKTISLIFLYMISSLAAASTIDFESLDVITIDDPASTVTSDDFVFNSTIAISDPGLIAASPILGKNSTLFLMFCPGCLLEMEHVQGFSFDLDSLAFAPLITGDVDEMVVTGFFEGGGTIQRTTSSIVTATDWDTVVFDSQWAGLTRLEIATLPSCCVSFGMAVDNIVVSNVVPIPAAVWLFGSALVLLGWVQRRVA
jgi:hypothetical protein